MLCIYIKDTFTLWNKTDTDKRLSTHVKKKWHVLPGPTFAILYHTFPIPD